MPATQRTLPVLALVATPGERTLKDSEHYNSEELGSLQGRLKFMRLHRGLTQKQLADAVGVVRSTAAQWESETLKNPITPSLGMIEKICEVLDTTPEWLTYRRGDPELIYPNKHSSEHVYVPITTFGKGPKNLKFGARWGVPLEALTKELGSEVNPDNIILYEVEDDAAQPYYNQGEKVFVDLDDKRVTKNGIFLYWKGDGPALAAIQYVARKTKPYLLLSSGEQGSTPVEMDLDDVDVIGRVKGKLKLG